MTYGQCDARPTITFPATECHYSPLTSTKLYCLVNSGTCVNNLPNVITWKVPGLKLNQQPWGHQSDMLPLHPQATGKWRAMRLVVITDLGTNRQRTQRRRHPDMLSDNKGRL